MAMIWGCSRRMSSATARASIHLRASSPLVERPMLIRSMMLVALSWPSASTRTLRRKSSAPTPTEVWLSTEEENSVMMVWTSSFDTLASFAMAAPMRCTSLAPMCFNTCAASCSPSVSKRIAARSVPVRSASFLSIILGHPTSYDLCYALRILVHQCSRLHHLLLVIERGCLSRARQCLLRNRFVGGDGARQHRHGHLVGGGSNEIFDQRTNYREHQHQQYDQAADDLGYVQEQGRFPDLRRLQFTVIRRRS